MNPNFLFWAANLFGTAAFVCFVLGNQARRTGRVDVWLAIYDKRAMVFAGLAIVYLALGSAFKTLWDVRWLYVYLVTLVFSFLGYMFGSAASKVPFDGRDDQS